MKRNREDEDYVDESASENEGNFEEDLKLQELPPVAARFRQSKLKEESSVVDLFSLELKQNHEQKPSWVFPNKDPSKGHSITAVIVLLEVFSQMYKKAVQFLIAVAEPTSRPNVIHEYQLTPSSLYAAVSIGFPQEEILRKLNEISKVSLTNEITDFIKSNTENFGEAKLVLKNNRFFIEGSEPTLQTLLKDDEIASYSKNNVFLVEDQNKGEFNEEKYAFEVDDKKVQSIRRRCSQINFPLLEEYDFRNEDSSTERIIDIRLKSSNIRPYQKKALAKVFGNNRARSGLIVLPCGAGKSLVGVACCATIRRPAVVLCINSISAEQWRREFKMWTTVSDMNIVLLTKKTVDRLDKHRLSSCILIATYSMVAGTKKISAVRQEVLSHVCRTEWGIMVLDEVHTVPSNQCRGVLSNIHSHIKIGLTATLVREDGKIKDLDFILGPKLFEANWQDLVRQNYLANVQCLEILCPMSKEFKSEYFAADDGYLRTALTVLCPSKMSICDYLISFHKDDKILIFCDSIIPGLIFSEELFPGIKFVHGGMKHNEREEVLKDFKSPTSGHNVLLFSRVGDVAIDLPDANVVIQICSHGSSRRQETQRLGRILRRKPRLGSEFNAFFYSLVTTDSREMDFSSKRQRYLIDQGYSYKTWRYDSFSLTQKPKHSEQEILNIIKRRLFGTTVQTIEPNVTVKKIKTSTHKVEIQTLTGGSGMSLSVKKR